MGRLEFARIYRCVSAGLFATNMLLSGLTPAVLFARSLLPDYLPGLLPFIRLHGSRDVEGPRRFVGSDVGRLMGPAPGGLPGAQEPEVQGFDATAQSDGGSGGCEACAKGPAARSSRTEASRGRGRGRRGGGPWSWQTPRTMHLVQALGVAHLFVFGPFLSFGPTRQSDHCSPFEHW